MAIYHLNLSHISRGKGQLVCASAAYRAAEKIYDHRNGKLHDYSRKTGVHDSEILAPSYAPDWVYDREELWNSVESFERRKNSRTASEIDVAIPVELDNNQKINLVREFSKIFTDRGLIADVAYHDFNSHNPHAHILISTRSISEQGWTPNKDQGIQKRSFLEELRSSWEKLANQYLENSNSKQRIDHRTLEAQGINRVPQIHLGPNVSHMEAKGIETDRGDEWRDINRTNERINALLAAKKGEKQEVEKLEKQITEEEESEDYLHQRHPIEENQTKNEANPLTKLTNFLSKFSHNRDDFENFDQIIIHFPEPLEYQFPIHTANPLATSITNLSPNGNNIETKQALKLANKYQLILNDIEDQLNHIGNIDNKEIKMQSSVDNEQWRIGNNQDHTEFWIVRENKTETEVKIHLQSEKDKISLEYNLEGGDFHQLHSKLIEKLKSIPTVIFDNKPRSQPEPEIAPEPRSQPEPEIIPEPKSQPEPEIAPEPKSQPEPEIIPEPRSKPKPEITPERDREITTKYLLKPAVAAAKKETATFSEFKQQLERQLITVEEEKKENNEIKLYYTWHGDRKFTIDGNEIGGTLPDLMEKGIHYAPKSQLDQSNLIEEERPGEEQQQQQNENERIEKNKLGEEEQQQNENERIEKDKLREEQQQRKQIEEENRRIQEEEQRKQQQQKSTKRKQKRQQQKPNQDWEL